MEEEKMLSSTSATCLLVAILAVLALSILTAAATPSEASHDDALLGPGRFRLTKILSIEWYQRSFDKHYGSILETLRRMKILFAKGIRVFVSAVNYLRGLSRSYKNINHFSDRTEAELAQLSDKRQAEDDPVVVKTREKRDVRRSARRHRLQLADLYEHQKGEDASEQAELTADKLVALIKGESGDELKPRADDEEMVEENREEEAVFVDHRKCLGPARDQGYIGTCYAFSSVALAEWLYCHNTGKRLLFSEQFIVDCGWGYESLSGAGGGFERDVAKFIGEFGLEMQQNYPYNQTYVFYCPYKRADESQLMGQLKLNAYRYEELLELDSIESALRETPLVASVNIGDDWFEYGGGVFENPGHDKEEAETHSILIVGSGRQEGADYWLIRNSHGASWGEEGYLKLAKSCPCIYRQRAYRPDVSFVGRKWRIKLNSEHEPRRGESINYRKKVPKKRKTKKKKN